VSNVNSRIVAQNLVATSGNWKENSVRSAGSLSFHMEIVMFKMPAAILENTKLDRFHPIVFRWNPQPSADAGEHVSRYKSAAHCTGGFKTIEEAQAAIASHENWWATGEVFSWDGEDIPAMIRWYENKL
jgi:hypothetical protein